jgi:hypothetical protein
MLFRGKRVLFNAFQISPLNTVQYTRGKRVLFNAFQISPLNTVRIELIPVVIFLLPVVIPVGIPLKIPVG